MPSVLHVRPPLGRHFLQAWREFRDITQDEAAKVLGLSRTQLSKVENGRSPYSQYLLEAAAVAYRTTPAALISVDPGAG